MKYYESVIDLIGHTPLVKLNRIVEQGMADIYLKLENFNPGGSVKDRMAIHMIRAAEQAGKIKPGYTLVESTSGNTGMGLAVSAAALGYRCVFTIPDKMAQEKIDMLKAYGAEVVVTPTDVDHDAPDGYVQVAKRIAHETPKAFYVDQYSNMANPESHYLTTGPEIWDDTEGKIDCLVGGIGTGGTISGAAKYIKEQAAHAGRTVRVVCPDPIGSIYYDVFNKTAEIRSQVYAVEGVGHDFLVDTLDFSVIDEVMPVSDKDSFLTARRLTREEGIFAGGSAGTSLFGAMQVAREMGPEKTIVVIIPDSGDRYISKCYNDEWMKDKGYLDREERMGMVSELVHFKGGSVETAAADEPISAVVARMSKLGYSQMPLSEKVDGTYWMIRELDLLHSLLDGKCRPSTSVIEVATPAKGVVEFNDRMTEVSDILSRNEVAVVVHDDQIMSIISKIDMVRFLAARS